MTSARLSADDFITEKVIGRGAFGEVQLVSFMFVYTHVSGHAQSHVKIMLSTCIFCTLR